MPKPLQPVETLPKFLDICEIDYSSAHVNFDFEGLQHICAGCACYLSRSGEDNSEDFPLEAEVPFVQSATAIAPVNPLIMTVGSSWHFIFPK